VQFLVNDLSLHGQFRAPVEFFESVDVLMSIRQRIRRAGWELFCHREMVHAQVTPELTMPQVIQYMRHEKRIAWMQWLTRLGPYWSDERKHGDDDWLELEDGTIVTDGAIGEAAFCRLHGLDRDTVSIVPSDWEHNPVQVTWRKGDGEQRTVDVPNHWSADSVDATLKTLPSPFDSWESLSEYCKRACERLTFADNAFETLKGHRYVHGAADRILIRLQLLNTMCGCFDEDGNRTAEGHRLYTDHFTGDKAWFSDSSDTEKNDFKSELTFPHPEKDGEYLFCPWHGKVKTPQLRIHFSWPIANKTPLYIVYVGPKITKQ